MCGKTIFYCAKLVALYSCGGKFKVANLSQKDKTKKIVIAFDETLFVLSL